MTLRERKMRVCIRLAKECSRDSWQVPNLLPGTVKALRAVAREAMQDARYWRELTY